MKKFISVFLSLIIVIGMITIPAHAQDIEVEISGIKNSSEATYLVKIYNLKESTAQVKAYVASYNANGTLKEAKTHVLSVEPGVKTAFSFKATADNGGTSKIYVWDSLLRPFSPSFTSDKCEEADLSRAEKINITTSDVWASYEPQSEYPASNTADGDLNTTWTVSGASEENPEYLTAYLGGDYILTKVGVSFGLTESRDYIFSFSAGEDGENFTTLFQKTISEKTDGTQYFDVPPVKAKYVRLNIYGRTDSGLWCRINEIEVYGNRDNTGLILMENDENWYVSPMDEMTYTDYEPTLGSELYAESSQDGLFIYDNADRDGKVDGEKLEFVSVIASQTPQENYSHTNTIDANASTIWTASGVTDDSPAYLVADLGESYYLTGVGICFDMGSSRTYTFDVSVSENGSDYTKVITKTTSASTNDTQYFKFLQSTARYIKYTFYSRTDSSNNGWIRIAEVEAYGGNEPIEGAGGLLAQKSLLLPGDRGDYEISFSLNLSGNTYYSGVSVTDGVITGGADLDNYTALSLRFENSNGKFKINRLVSNYFNEGTPVGLFENTFNLNENVNFSLLVSPVNRTVHITVSDSDKSETQLVYFNYSDSELTRNTSWTYLEANTIVFNTGAGAKVEMKVTDFKLRQVDRENGNKSGNSPVNGIIRLEAVRTHSYPTSSGDYYGRYVYHNGENAIVCVAADKNPQITRFVERRGLLGCGVSFEAVTKPGYYIMMEDDAFYLKKIENTGDFYSRATFFKDSAENVGYYTGNTFAYRTYRQLSNEDKYLYDTTQDKKTGELKPWKMWAEAQGSFYLRSEASEYVCDNFYGNSISSQWWTNYPWKSNNPTKDSYNFSALITKNNVIVENGELLLKATPISSGAWPANVSGDTGIQYNGDFGRTDWKKWQAYVGVVSIQNKLFNKQCYIEGSFKQPESPIGYWNAFWLAGRDSWPPEIDIFETLSSKYGAYAWHTAIHGQNDSNNLFGKQTSNINITTDYHTFAMDWGYDYIKFYVDGKLFQRTHNNDTLNFQKNLRLILNTGIGGWENEPDDTMVWNDGLRCRYIRAFQYQ